MNKTMYILVIAALLLVVAGCGETASPGNSGEGTKVELTGNEMLDAHNVVRQNVSPAPSTPIPDLVWDDELAASAQAWADRCKFEHSGPGENLFASSGSGTAPQQVVDSWAGEAASYTYDNNSCSGVCGHYTQLVWRDTVHIGCAATSCDNLAAFGGPGELWVCQYDPPGNFIGRKPY